MTIILFTEKLSFAKIISVWDETGKKMHKPKKFRRPQIQFSLLALAVLWLYMGNLGGVIDASAVGQDSEVSAFLDKLADRISSYPRMEKWTASVRSRVEEMDKNWKPKKTTLITKKVSIDGTDRSEEILEALEVKKGKTKDRTRDYIKEARKEAEKAEKRKEKGREGGRQGRLELTRSQLFPFDMEQRKNLQFSIKEETTFKGIPVTILESRSSIKDEDLYSGTYTIARDSLDVLRIDIFPTKKPSVLKMMKMAFEFQVLPEGPLAIKRTWFKMHLNVIIKVIRLEAEEEYFDIKILE
jgi:hypothetical protein